VLAVLAAVLVLAPATAMAQAGPQTGPGALNRFVDPESNHLVTPAPAGDPYRFEGTLGYLLPSAGPGRRAIHGCDAGGADRFLSLDPACEGRRSLGLYGYAYLEAPAGIDVVPLYRCLVPGKDHFASGDPGCEGKRQEGRLGFLRARGEALLRYAGERHVVTAGPVADGLRYGGGLGFLLPTGGDGKHAIHGCVAGADRFLSLDPGCEGRTRLGVEGYAYDAPPVAEESQPVHRCLQPGVDHFASLNADCEGTRPEGNLGHLRTYGDALVQYDNATTGTSWVTPGAVAPGYRAVRTLGFLVRVGGGGLVAVHGCRAGEDHFLSTDAGCEGRTGVGRYGFAYASPPADQETVALHRCVVPGRRHYASLDFGCEGGVREGRLGYVRTTEQGPPPPPACGPSGARTTLALPGRSRARYFAFGRGTTVTGRALRADGSPAAGATVSLLADAGALEEVAQTQAGRDGGFGFSVAPGPSRTLRAGFRAAPGDPALACGQTVRVRIRAGLRLRASDRRVRNGQRVRFRGQVLGTIPPTGKLVLLQALSRGRWRTFATPRTNSRGQFRGSYRFKIIRRATTIKFRVRAAREAAFPYARGTSRTVRVRVLPGR